MELLNAKHLLELDASGLSEDTIRRADIVSVDSTMQYLNFELGSGWICPFYGLNGDAPIYQVKPDNPRLDSEGKLVKYEWPASTPSRIYIPPMIKDKVMDPSVPIIITEGTKKALKAVQEGFPAIALSGVWGWLRNQEPLPDMKAIPWRERLVYLCLDSDVMSNVNVRQALFRLERFLRNNGAIVKVVALPEISKRSVESK